MGKIQRINSPALSGKLCRSLILFPLIIYTLFFLAACGKKGDPTLKEYEKPAAPSLLQAIHREETIILQWSYPAGKESAIADFIILKSSGAEFKQFAHAEKNKRSYEDTELDKGGNYRYKIIARNFKGVYSEDSNIIDIRLLDPPSPPSSLSFSIKDNTLILTWKPAGKDMFYNVYKSFERGKYGLYPANSSPLSENSFKDAFVINKPVYYTVRSLHGSSIRDEGIPSGELAVDPSELIPSPLKNCGYQTFPDKVYLFWDEPEESWVTRFRIYRRTAGQAYVLLGETQIPVFVDNEPALIKRDYRVHAVGPAKEGPGVEIRDILYKPE
jgi:predicted small lipoprotein YifL